MMMCYIYILNNDKDTNTRQHNTGNEYRTNNTSNDGWNPYPSIAAATACVTSTFNRRNIRASFFLLM